MEIMSSKHEKEKPARRNQRQLHASFVESLITFLVQETMKRFTVNSNIKYLLRSSILPMLICTRMRLLSTYQLCNYRLRTRIVARRSLLVYVCEMLRAAVRSLAGGPHPCGSRVILH